MRDYMMMAHYTDSAIGTLLSYLRSRPDYDRTLIVITGDHEGSQWIESSHSRQSRRPGIVSPGQYTPLIVVNSPVGDDTTPFSDRADIYPTLLNLLQLDSYRWKGMGNGILDPSKAPFAISSMTGELAGDTTTVSPRSTSNIRSARAISTSLSPPTHSPSCPDANGDMHRRRPHTHNPTRWRTFGRPQR